MFIDKVLLNLIKYLPIIPNSDKDCSGTCYGPAYYDDCNVCDANTENDGISCNIPCTQQESLQYDCYDGSQYCWNYDENVYCGCDLSPLLCSECENDDSGGSWLDCICEYSDINGTVSNYNSSSAMPYAIGDQLSFSDINVEFSTCYPDCNDTFSLSDYSGKKFLIIYEEDW